MFRYVLAILLVTFYHSLGTPVRTTSKQITESILGLENSCGNVFLKSVLNSNAKQCFDVALTAKIKQLQCLMFYDMGSQLCTAVNTSGLTLNEDYNTKINEEADINNLCETAKHWVFPELQEYHSYKSIIERMFVHPVTCGKMCGSDELMSDDANFFCKFYKWGWDTIKTHMDIATHDNTNIGVIALIQQNTTINSSTQVETGASSNEQLDISIKSTTSSDKPKETLVSVSPSDKISASDNINTKPLAPATVLTMDQASHQIATNVKKPEEPIVTDNKSVKPLVKVQEDIVKEAQNEKVSPLGETDKKDLNIEPDQKESVLENPKEKALIESDHYGDDDFNSEDGKEENDDLHGDEDNGDPMINDNIKQPVKKTKTNTQIDIVVSSFNKEREFYSGTPQEVGADGVDVDDDHFFTFFLTAVVLVVLLYILYHDKSKISKLFFGLLVEGRQAGRRRNSRGHAYRRLDTLEQAMSTNTTAPPSKIIY